MQDRVVWGLGQLGRLLGGGALRAGCRVTPITREVDPEPVWERLEAHVPILMCVGEASLEACVNATPAARRRDLVFVQNELFPSRFLAFTEGEQPTVLVFWSNVKRSLPLMIGRRSAVFGPHAQAVSEIHAALDIPCEVLPDAPSLSREIVAKYAFILTINVLGLQENATLGTWLERPEAVRPVLDDAIALGWALAGASPHGGSVREDVHEAMRGLATIPSRGRTAGKRLERALEQAAELGVAVPALRSEHLA